MQSEIYFLERSHMKLLIKIITRSIAIIALGIVIVSCAEVTTPAPTEGSLQQYSQLVKLYGKVSAVPSQSFDFMAHNQFSTWKVVNRQYGGVGSAVISMIPANQNLIDWEQSIVITTALLKDAPTMTIETAIHDITAVSNKACRRVDTNILAKTNTMAILTMRNSRCKDGYKVLNEIHTIKIIRGTDAIHIAHYTLIKNNLTPRNLIQNTENIIQNATLVPTLNPDTTNNTQ